MSDKPLLSAVVLCYRHFEYLYDAIDAVLMQDYPAVELVVSDDGSPVFPQKEIEQYIESHKRSNLKQYLVRTGAQNVGTVRHLNQARRCVHGEYVVFLAGDDCLHDEHVLSSYVEGFSRAPKNCYIEMAQTGMYDENLEKLQELYMTLEVKRALEKTETDSRELLQLLITKGACLPSTSTCFTREFFERFGDFDETYMLVEDYPMHIRLAKEHWIIHCESFIAIKHRHGGISHGQKGALRKSQVMYYTDTRKMVQELQIGNLAELPPTQRRKVRTKKEAELLWIDMLLTRSEDGFVGMIKLAAKHPVYAVNLVLDKFVKYAEKWLKRLFVICLGGWVLSPALADILGTSLNLPQGTLLSCVKQIAQILFALWCLMLVLALLIGFRSWLNRFPDELLHS